MAASESSFRLMQLNTSRLLLAQLYAGASDGLFSCGRGAEGYGRANRARGEPWQFDRPTDCVLSTNGAEAFHPSKSGC